MAQALIRGLVARIGSDVLQQAGRALASSSATSCILFQDLPFHYHLQSQRQQRQLHVSRVSQSTLPVPVASPAPPVLPATPHASSLSPFPPTAPAGPLSVQYPNKSDSDYFSDREAVILGLDGTPRGLRLLPGQVFNVPVRLDVLHRVVRWLRAMWQQGTHKAKHRGEVKGGGRKPSPQKGTGRARHGSIRSPIWKGGGVAHGPRPRSHAHQLPVALQLQGYKCALSAKANEGHLVLVDSLAPAPVQLPDGKQGVKTKATKQQLQGLLTPLLHFRQQPKSLTFINKLGQEVQRQREVCNGSVLLVDSGETGPDGGQALRRGARNLPWVSIMGWQDVTVYHILKHRVLVMTARAAEAMAARLQQPLPEHAARPVRAAWWKEHQQSYMKAMQALLAAQEQQHLGHQASGSNGDGSSSSSSQVGGPSLAFKPVAAEALLKARTN